MEYKDVEERLNKALNHLLAKDGLLLIDNVNERSISHKLAEYLQAEFPEWNVDCEYNRNMDKVKKVIKEYVSNDNLDAKTVYPDIIIHHRNTSNNLLIIEIKKNATKLEEEDDTRKIKGFIKTLHYKYGVFIDLDAGSRKIGIRKIKQIE